MARPCKGSDCQFKTVYSVWQPSMPKALGHGAGYSTSDEPLGIFALSDGASVFLRTTKTTLWRYMEIKEMNQKI